MNTGEERFAYFSRPFGEIASEQSRDLTILLAAACILLGGMLALYALAVLGATDDPSYSVTAASSFG
jgi:Flp pilus assembly protein protease CpaA